MKSRNFWLLMSAVVVLGIAAYYPRQTGLPAEKDAVILQSLVEGINRMHFQPQEINDDFSRKVYDLYLDRLDGRRMYLTQEDINRLKPFEKQLDDQINRSSFEFFDLSVQLLDQGILKAERIFNEWIDKNFDLSTNEMLETDPDKKTFAKNDAELTEYWRKMIKYSLLLKVAEKIKEAEDDQLQNGSTTAPTSLKAREAEFMAAAKEEVRKDYENLFKRIHKQKRNDRLSIYLNSIANIFDPHTEYYEPVEKQNFDINMSGRLEGIGARLQTLPDGEYTKVSDIIVGGPAWKQKELEVDDVIMKVQQEGKEAVDIAGMEINEVVSLIRGPKGTLVTLTIKRKADGSIKPITIQREEVIIDEGYVKSLIIEDKEVGKKIGYIKLPRFYADFDNDQGHQCATDVAIELEKLKAQRVEGIILDLRYNGGGSLRDVVRMSGFFIEKGPIVQVKARDAKPEVLSDTDPQVQYGGPLVIMVNEFSASASEIMAAAMQDYGRAIIVGTKTYGKGTVQRFFDLDRTVRGFDEFKPLGEVKLTIQKFYRINGGSTQLEGVTPDIILPDNYLYVPVGEREMEYPMAWTKIESVPFSQNVVRVNGVNRYAEISTARQKGNQTFSVILDNARHIKAQRDATEITLNLKEFLEQDEQDEKLGKKFEEVLKPIDQLTAQNLPEDIPAIEADESKKARNEEWLKDVHKDVHLYETLAIMYDMMRS